MNTSRLTITFVAYFAAAMLLVQFAISAAVGPTPIHVTTR